MGAIAARRLGNFFGKSREKHNVSTQGNVEHLTFATEVCIEIRKWTCYSDFSALNSDEFISIDNKFMTNLRYALRECKTNIFLFTIRESCFSHQT